MRGGFARFSAGEIQHRLNIKVIDRARRLQQRKQ